MTASLPGHDIVLSAWATPPSRGSATLTALRPDPPQATTVMAGHIGLLPPWLLPSLEPPPGEVFSGCQSRSRWLACRATCLTFASELRGCRRLRLEGKAPVVGLADFLGPQGRTKWSNPGGTTCVGAIFSLPVASCIMVAGRKPRPQVDKEMLLIFFFFMLLIKCWGQMRNNQCLYEFDK